LGINESKTAVIEIKKLTRMVLFIMPANYLLVLIHSPKGEFLFESSQIV
jgi:hypothetical protein